MIKIDASSVAKLRDSVQRAADNLAPKKYAENTAKKQGPKIRRIIHDDVERELRKQAKTKPERKAAKNMADGIRVDHERRGEETDFTVHVPVYAGTTDYDKIKELNWGRIKNELGDDVVRWVRNKKRRDSRDQIKSHKSRKEFTVRPDGSRQYKTKFTKTPEEIGDRVMAVMAKDPQKWLQSADPNGLLGYLQKNNPIGLATVIESPAPGVTSERATEMSDAALDHAADAIIHDVVEPVLDQIADVLDNLFE